MTLVSLVVQANAIASVALYLKFFGTVLIQGGTKFSTGSRAPEDSPFGKKGTSQSFGLKTRVDQDDKKLIERMEKEMRWNRIVGNDLESLPFGLVTAWSACFACYSPVGHAVAVSLYVLSRYAHTLSYSYAKQPHRFLSYATSAGCIMFMGFNVLAGAFKL